MRFWLIIGLVLSVTLLIYQFNIFNTRQRVPISTPLSHIFDSRIHYHIGYVDPRFGLSSQQLQQIIQEAADIWHQGTGKELFVEDKSSVLSINLIFDDRQQQSNLRHDAQRKLQFDQAEQLHQTNQYQEKKQLLEVEHQQLVAQQAALKDKLNRYNQTVHSWNTLGTIDTYTRNQLEQERAQIDRDKQAVQASLDAYNQQVQETNQLRQNINNHVDQYNQSVAQFNTVFSPREFEKGIFNGRDINIYEFESVADLRLTIAHELGHALGLKHNNDPYALMYPLMKQQNLEDFRLRPADLAMLPK